MADPELSLDGKPLLFDQDQQAGSFLRLYQPLSDLIDQIDRSIQSINSKDSSVGPALIGLPRPNYPEVPPPRINQLYWPTGASRWARGYFIATKTDADAIATRCGEEIDLVARVNDHTTTFKVYALTPRAVSCVDDSEHDNLYLIPVVDKRYWWQFRSYGDMGKPDIDSWSGLISHIGGRLGVSITLDSVDSSYLAPDPDEFTRRYDNAATLLDAASHSIGQRVVHQFDGTVRSIGWTDSASEYGNNLSTRTPWWKIAGDEEILQPIPESVTAVFPKTFCGIPSCDREYYPINVLASQHTSQCTAVSTEKTIHSTAWANYTPSGSSPINLAELTSLAGAIARDYFAGTEEYYDHTFVGLKDWYFTGYDDHALISFGTEDETPEVTVSTFISSEDEEDSDANSVVENTYTRGYFVRVQSAPLNFGVDQMLHRGDIEPKLPEGILPLELVSSCLEPGSFGNAYLLEWSGQNWVADTQCTVQVFDPYYRNYILSGERFYARRSCESSRLEIVGENGLERRAKANVDIAYGGSGLVTVYRNDEFFQDCEPVQSVCELTVCNAWGIPTQVNQDDKIFIKFFERRWQVRPVASELKYVEAQECIYPGKFGDAKVLEFNGTAWVVTAEVIRIYDDSWINFLAPNERTWVKTRSDGQGGTVGDIIGSQGLMRLARPAAGIECDASGSVTVYKTTAENNCTPAATNCSVTACNSWHNNRKIASDEETFIGFYGKTWIFLPFYKPRWGLGVLTADLCQGTASVGSIYYLDGCDVAAISAEALNPFALQAMAGDPVLVLEAEGGLWYLIQVKHQLQTIISDIGFDDDTCQLQALTLYNAAVMTCREQSLEMILQFTEYDLVTGFETTQPTASNGNTCRIQATTKTFCMPQLAAQPSTPITVAEFTPQLVLQDIDYSDTPNCIDGFYNLLYVLCSSDEEQTPAICGDDCNPSGSGSQ